MFETTETQLREAVDRFAPSGRPAAELRAVVVEAERLCRLAAVVRSKAVAAWREAVEGTGEGGRRAPRTLGLLTGVSGREARDRLAAVDALAAAPLTRAAFEAGDLSGARVRVLVWARRQAPEVFTGEEGFLLGRVSELGVEAAWAFVRDWARRVDPDGHSDAAKRTRRCCVTGTDDDGMGTLRAVLDPAGAAVVQTELSRLTQQLFGQEADCDPDGDRTPLTQLRADALVAMARRSAGLSDSSPEGHPTVLAVIDATRLGTDQLSAVTSAGVDLDRDSVHELLCDAGVSRVVLGPDGVILDKGRTTRLATRHQRDALFARWGGCACGCDTPWPHTKIHHIVHWAHGGATDIDNLLPVCHATHQAIHQGRLTVHVAPGGAVELRRADGTPLPPPARHRTHLAHRADTPIQRRPSAA